MSIEVNLATLKHKWCFSLIRSRQDKSNGKGAICLVKLSEERTTISPRHQQCIHLQKFHVHEGALM